MGRQVVVEQGLTGSGGLLQRRGSCKNETSRTFQRFTDETLSRQFRGPGIPPAGSRISSFFAKGSFDLAEGLQLSGPYFRDSGSELP